MSSLNPYEQLENAELLLREISHRINNEFASAISVVSLAASRSTNKEVKLALASVVDHLHSYARVHRALQVPLNPDLIDASTYMRALCQSISRSKLDCRGIELIYVERPVTLSSERCATLGMIVCELITNAARHAFDEVGGTIQVELSYGGSLIECCVIDNGVSRGPINPGQGMKIIEALARRLDGDFLQTFGLSGARSQLVFPK